MRFGVISRVAPLRIGVHMDYPLVHGPDLCRRLMPRPKLGRSRSTIAAAAPATFRTVHLEVVGREQMAIPADTGSGHKPEDRFRRKGHDMTLGCIKARPRYQFQRFGLPRRAAFGGLHSLPSPIAGPRTFCRETLLQRFAEMSLKLRRSSRSCMTFIDQRAPVVGRVSTREHLRKTRYASSLAPYARLVSSSFTQPSAMTLLSAWNLKNSRYCMTNFARNQCLYFGPSVDIATSSQLPGALRNNCKNASPDGRHQDPESATKIEAAPLLDPRGASYYTE